MKRHSSRVERAPCVRQSDLAVRLAPEYSEAVLLPRTPVPYGRLGR